MRMLRVRVKPRRNTGIPPINLTLRYQKTVEDAMDVDSKMGTDLREKTIRKDMMNVRIAFENLDGMTSEKMRTGKIKPGYKYFSTRIILY